MRSLDYYTFRRNGEPTDKCPRCDEILAIFSPANFQTVHRWASPLLIPYVLLNGPQGGKIKVRASGN